MNALTVPALFIVKLFKNATSDEPASWSTIFKAAVGLVFWFIITGLVGFLWVAIGFSYVGEFEPNPPALWNTNIMDIGISAAYLLIGCGLVYWVWRPEKIDLP